MTADDNNNAYVTQAFEVFIRLGLIFALVVWSFQIVRPFITPIVWGMIIAMATLTRATRTAIRMMPPAMPNIPEINDVTSVVARMMAAASALMRALVR